ncbi:MAG: hypothetical protein A2Y12_03655 [Planctomycetes bacterium GWF2_42_9]|nr:MAG: hypothetical protein A2Y12_03655 [Planctomycetes bacterium GWF2_42_9]
MNIAGGESAITLERFILGARSAETTWCDWDIPLHWGGMSDPFQPSETDRRKSYEFLEIFAKHRYPVVFSTKGKVVAEPKYLDLIKQCNCAAQVSMVCKSAEMFEHYAPSFDDRVNIARALAPNVRRLIIRIQPYLPQYKREVLDLLSLYKEIGAYGVTIEGLKIFKRSGPLTVRIGADFCLPAEILKRDFVEIRRECHRLGLKFYSAENRLRYMGESLCCCGVEGIDGWAVNTANLNHIYFGNDAEFTEGMKLPCTGGCFNTFYQTKASRFSKNSYYENMMAFAKGKLGRNIYGISCEERNKNVQHIVAIAG